MISKKNKALVAGLLAAATTASALVPAMGSAAWENSYATEGNANASYKDMFKSLYDDVITNGQKNGYLSSQTNGKDSFGIPYHSVETLCVEAPDYGHETTSEAMSYIVWMAAMHDVLLGGSDLDKAWKTMEAMIPGWSEASGIMNTIKYNTIWKQEKLKADTADEGDTPKAYPVNQNGVDALNPYYTIFKSAYSSDNGYYLMNWLADVDDWYGFGGGKGKFTYINTFQRGEQESCFETVPQPCIEELKYGNTEMKDENNGNGIKAIFNGDGKVPKQYSFTNAPDAEDRAIQAVYFANRYTTVTDSISAAAGKMGDQCRNDMFDKYYHAIGCQNIDSASVGYGKTGETSQHFLMAWYTSWGGALQASYGDYQWAWQIGCSHSHQFYQNPLAAYGLINNAAIKSGMKAEGAVDDYKESLKRQLEMYLWLQSVDGPFAGGCTNSWRGRYEKYPTGHATFYDMAYVAHPVYADPGSNHWIGNQVWSTQRLAELYYDLIKNGNSFTDIKPGGLSMEDALDALLERWIAWFEENTKFEYTDPKTGKYMSYAIPSTLDWGSSDTDYTCTPDSWTGTYNPNGNQKLTCVIGGYGQGDIGCVSSLCNTLIYYAAAKGVKASEADPRTATDDSVAAKGLRLANRLMSAQWEGGRDEIGLAYEDSNGSLKRMFEEEVYIPDYYKGEMPDGSKLEPGATFASIRTSYEKDPMFQECKKVYEATGETETYTYKLHRFWHMGDAVMTLGTMALLYPDVDPLDPEVAIKGEGGGQTTTGGGSSLTAEVWGDANCDGKVSVADVVLIMQSQANPGTYKITEQGAVNADVDNNGNGITSADALMIQQYLLKQITSLDPTK